MRFYWQPQNPAPSDNRDEDPSKKILKPSPDEKEQKPVESLWKELKDLQTKRKILDENLAIVERGRGREDIVAAMEYDILSMNPGTDP